MTTIGGRSSALAARATRRYCPTSRERSATNDSNPSNRGGDDLFHGATGPLSVAAAHPDHPLCAAFLDAGVEAGYPRTEDVNGRQQEGFGPNDRTTSPDGKRASTAHAYLDPIRARPNLTIATRALVHHVCLAAKRAVGVVYERNNRRLNALASREVILAGGAINSPQLLMLSGIGPADQLREHGIDIVHPLPGVGENLQDHVGVNVVQACTQPITLHDSLSAWGKLKIGLRWFLRHDGAGATNHFDAGAFIRSGAEIEHPDLKLAFLIAGFDSDAATLDASVGQHAFSTHVNLMRPTSRGRLTLRSPDPHHHPRLRFNYLDTPEDARTLVTGLKLVREIHAQPALTPYRGVELSPGPQFSDDTDIETWVRNNAGTSYHPTSTCRIGASTDPIAVVDAQLRVHGIEALRVVDASVMPDLVSGNTNAPTIMIGEKAADLILGRPPLKRADVDFWIHPD